jgi:hypothetical protein
MVRLRQGALSNVEGRGSVEVRTCCRDAIGRQVVWMLFGRTKGVVRSRGAVSGERES